MPAEIVVLSSRPDPVRAIAEPSVELTEPSNALVVARTNTSPRPLKFARPPATLEIRPPDCAFTVDPVDVALSISRLPADCNVIDPAVVMLPSVSPPTVVVKLKGPLVEDSAPVTLMVPPLMVRPLVVVTLVPLIAPPERIVAESPEIEVKPTDVVPDTVTAPLPITGPPSAVTPVEVSVTGPPMTVPATDNPPAPATRLTSPAPALALVAEIVAPVTLIELAVKMPRRASDPAVTLSAFCACNSALPAPMPVTWPDPALMVSAPPVDTSDDALTLRVDVMTMSPLPVDAPAIVTSPGLVCVVSEVVPPVTLNEPSDRLPVEVAVRLPAVVLTAPATAMPPAPPVKPMLAAAFALADVSEVPPRAKIAPPVETSAPVVATASELSDSRAIVLISPVVTLPVKTDAPP